MCVIMCKASGIEFPPVDEIKNCCDANPDGFGAMWADGEKVRMFKTMSKDAFMRWYETFHKTMSKAVPLVIHARIATHGSKKIENCHPWLDTGNKKGKIGFCHNGILSIKNRGDLTDSETFFRDLWLPAFKAGGEKMADNATKACIGTSRFCFLYANGNTERWGNWEEGSVKGCFYTNSSWKKNRWVGGCYSGGSTYGGNYGYNGGYYGGGYWDDDDVCLGPTYKKPETAKPTPSKTLPQAVTSLANHTEAVARVEWLKLQPDFWRISYLFYGEWRWRVSKYTRDMLYQDALVKEAEWAPHRCPLWNLFNINTSDFENGNPKNADVKMVCDVIEKFNTKFNLLSIKGILSLN